MKFSIFMLPTIYGTDEDRLRLRPIGRDTGSYQTMLDELREIAVFCDDAGFDLFSTTEHHFHSEGYEMSASPLLLYLDLANRTKRIKFAPMSLVLTAWDPIRLAEEVAIFDQLTQGRLMVGFARGYQDRWINVLGQKNGVKGTPMDGSDVDLYNREVFEDHADIIFKAWAEDSFSHVGKHYQVPVPGITRWPPIEATRKFGGIGEVAEDGSIAQVSVVPAPFQRPHPPLVQAFSTSPRTIEFAAKNNAMPFMITAWHEAFRHNCELYQAELAKLGQHVPLGKGIGVMRPVHFGKDKAEALALLERTHYRSWYEYFAGFGFWEATRMPSDEEKYPKANGPLPKSEWTVQRMVDSGYSLAGTVDDIKREIEKVRTVHGAGGDVEWFSWYFDQGFMSRDDAMRQLEIFAEHIIPEFKD